MKKIRLIAIDMDGTWLRTDCTVSAKTREAVLRAIDAGYLVVPTTGRSYRNSREVLKDHQGIRYYINANGSTVMDGEKEVMIHAESFSKETAREIYDLVIQYESFAEIYEGGEAYVDRFGREFLYRAGLSGDYVEQLLSTNVTLDSLDTFMEEESRKITKFHIVCSNIDRKNQLKNKIAELPGVYPISVIPVNIEVVNGHWSKAHGLTCLADHLGILPEEVMAIGDSNNDLEMLRWAGISVAMGNAPDHVKELCDYVTSSNDEDGIVRALAHYLDI